MNSEKEVEWREKERKRERERMGGWEEEERESERKGEEESEDEIWKDVSEKVLKRLEEGGREWMRVEESEGEWNILNKCSTGLKRGEEGGRGRRRKNKNDVEKGKGDEV